MRITPGFLLALAVLALSFAFAHPILAQSSAIGFQAKLTGVADGPHTMTFSLYDTEVQLRVLQPRRVRYAREVVEYHPLAQLPVRQSISAAQSNAPDRT